MGTAARNGEDDDEGGDGDDTQAHHAASVQCEPWRVVRAAVLVLVVAAFATRVRTPTGGDSVGHRRALLERSLVNRDNAYARLRLMHYGRDWERLAEWNPKVATYDFGDTPSSSATGPSHMCSM